MANIVIKTTAEEQNKVIKALRELKEEPTSVSAVAAYTGLKQSRVRYAIIDLLDAGKIERVTVKAFNKHYIRYSYKVKEE